MATATTPSFRFAGFWLRLVAFLLDSLLVSVLQFVLSFLLLQASRLAGAPIDEKTFLIHLTLEFFGMVLAIAYFVFFTGYSGQTPGKRVMKLRVVRTDGTAVGYGRAFLREVPGKLLSGVLLGIGYLMVIFHPKKQGLHDLLADTYVIKT
ncbi:MAG: RDD family protein [Desulfuromonadales bacterium]|nr:RDD family protein [Desulfuromonadales bacterium]